MHLLLQNTSSKELQIFFKKGASPYTLMEQ